LLGSVPGPNPLLVHPTNEYAGRASSEPGGDGPERLVGGVSSIGARAADPCLLGEGSVSITRREIEY
jgi:hypothetical protein